MRTSDISSSEPDDPDKYIRSGSSYSSSWDSDSKTACNLLSMQFLSEDWTGVGGVNEGPADDDATVAFTLLNVMGICSMTTFIRRLLGGRRSPPFFFNLPIFACDFTTFLIPWTAHYNAQNYHLHSNDPCATAISMVHHEYHSPTMIIFIRHRTSGQFTMRGMPVVARRACLRLFFEGVTSEFMSVFFSQWIIKNECGLRKIVRHVYASAPLPTINYYFREFYNNRQ